jgi:hypothetical protein
MEAGGNEAVRATIEEGGGGAGSSRGAAGIAVMVLCDALGFALTLRSASRALCACLVPGEARR